MPKDFTVDPIATIAIVNPDDEQLRAVYGLYEGSKGIHNGKGGFLGVLDIVLLEKETTMPRALAEKFFKVVVRKSEELNDQFLEGKVGSPVQGWKVFNDPKGQRIFSDQFVGGVTGVVVKTTINPEKQGELSSLLRRTYGVRNSNGPETM